MSEYNTVLSTLTAALHDKSMAKKLTEIEMVLTLMESYSTDGDLRKSYLLLCGYSVIGAVKDSEYGIVTESPPSAAEIQFKKELGGSS